MTAKNAPVDQLLSTDWDRVRAVVARFEESWQSEQAPDIPAYWPVAGVDRLALLVELVHTDLEYRLKANEPVQVES